MTDGVIEDHRFEQEFVTELDGHRAIAAYQFDENEGVITFTHTIVPHAIEGRGVASRLIRFALDSARDRGLRVRPLCPFVRAFIERHPEYRDLLAKGG